MDRGSPLDRGQNPDLAALETDAPLTDVFFSGVSRVGEGVLVAPTLPAGSENQNEKGREAQSLEACVLESVDLGSGASWVQYWLCDLGQVISALYTL